MRLQRLPRCSHLVCAQKVRGGLADCDEWRGWGHLDERQAVVARRGNERSRDAFMSDADTEADCRYAGPAEACDEVTPTRVVCAKRHPCGEHELAALKVVGELQQLGRRNPAQLRILRRRLHEPKTERWVCEQLRQGGHAYILAQCKTFLLCTNSPRGGGTRS